MEEKNEKYIKGTDLSEENIDYLKKSDLGKDETNSKNKGQETLFISKKETEVNNNAEIENKEVPKAEIKEELKTTKVNNNAEIENKEVPKAEIKEELKTTKVNNNAEIKNKEVPKAEIKEELNKKNSENIVIKPKTDTNKILIEKSNQIIKDPLDVKPKVKPKKEIPIEKKPFNEFINDHLIPEIIKEFKIRGKVIEVINIKKTNRPISEDICWVIYCEIKETCNFWLSFEKEDITSLKSFSLCKNYEKPSIIESFLIDEKKITLKLIISRILQRLNGQKLIGAN